MSVKKCCFINAALRTKFCGVGIRAEDVDKKCCFIYDALRTKFCGVGIRAEDVG